MAGHGVPLENPVTDSRQVVCKIEVESIVAVRPGSKKIEDRQGNDKDEKLFSVLMKRDSIFDFTSFGKDCHKRFSLVGL